MATPGKRAIAILNRTSNSAQVKVDWKKLGFDDAPKSLRDVWKQRNLTAEAELSVPAEDLALLLVEGQDKAAAEYAANESGISRIQFTSGPTFAKLDYVNTSGHVLVVRVKSTSGLSSGIALAPTEGLSVGTVGLILPRGTADLSFEAQPAAIRKLAVYSWRSFRPD